MVEADRALSVAVANFRRADEARSKARARMLSCAKRSRDVGRTGNEVAEQLGVTRQRLAQLLATLED